MSTHRSEVQVSKSPAEFFAENQAIAGFDNMGKALYTTLREFIENSLDACESVNVLPSISVKVEEMTQSEFNVVRGLVSPSKMASGIERKDVALFTKSGKKGARKSLEEAPPPVEELNEESKDEKDLSTKKKRKRENENYFRVTVRDNGCGMSHDAIPNLLGRVLSGSKYGVRQTRGKFGLGAKMALIWSKKSTNMPIRVKTAHMKKPGELGSHVSTCVLDIDIYKNSPRVMEHKKQVNHEKWVGTEMEVLIAGNWTTYKARIVQYFQQLAIITPYAQLELTYQDLSDSKRDMAIRYDRRSEQMPPAAREVKHHPASVNNLLVQQLLERTTQKTLASFLCKDLSAISPALAKRLVTELGSGFDEGMAPSDLTDKHVTKLVQLLRSVELFKAPDGSCLSPLGEYNLNLGIRKVLESDLVATARDKACAHEGHPFIVEAAVSIGGKDVKEGITVVRFANRIPLLFEGGADVVTRVAQSKIRWATYKIDHKRDKVGVFVSIVSTKIPFKGTGKEYIGDDITEIQTSVKRALQNCCQQLRTHLAKKHALRDIKERKSKLIKYIPDVGRSLFGILEGMRKRRLEASTTGLSQPANKRLRPDNTAANAILDMVEKKEITEASIKKFLLKAVEQHTQDEGDNQNTQSKSRSNKDGFPLFLVPMYDRQSNQHDLLHPLFVFRPLFQVATKLKNKGK
jgi:DNA topoisomerase VI subunit B